MRDFWLATTPLNRDIANGRATQGGDIVQSRNGRKAMQESIEQYMDPEKIHDHLSRVADELQSSNDSAKRIGMACYEDLSNDKNFCHRRMIAERLSKKIGVPIPDISHLKIFQKEKGQENENPLQFYETTILDPMRAIAAREGLDLAKDKDALAKIFEKELPDLGRLNAIIKHWDSQREEPLPDAIAPGASRQVTDQLDDSKDTSIQHDYPHANITAKSWKSIFSNFSPRKIIYTDDAGEQLIAPSSESLYQALKLKPNSETGGLSDQAKLIAGMTPTEAKRTSRSLYQTSPDSFFSAAEFELKKIELMKTVLRLKAEQHPEFLDALLATGNEQIVESTGKRDAYWGVIDTPSGQKGRNVQGKLLMQIRDEIRGNQQSASAAPVAPAASPGVKEGIKGDIDGGQQGATPAVSSTMDPVMPFDQRSGVTSIRKTMSHASVQDRAFQRVLNGTDWQKQFFDSVNAGKYSAYLDGLRKGNGYTPEQIAAISLKIRQANVDGLKDRKDTKHLYSGARIADDGSTVLFDNPDTMKLLQASEPTLKRVMVSNHGIYLESEQPKRTTLRPVRKNFQYNHYQDGDGRKLYEQTKRVNYAEYEPGLWYSDIGSYSPGTPAK